MKFSELQVKLKKQNQNLIVKNAVTTSAIIDIEGFLKFGLMLKLEGGTTCCFGGTLVQYLPKSYKHHTLESPFGHHMFRCLEISDVTSFAALNGKAIRTYAEPYGPVLAIGHIINDDWYCPEIDFWNK